MKNLFETLRDRGYIYQSTDEENIKNTLNGEPVTFYLGIDPTADSLHIGHFFALMMFRYLQDAGHRGILVVGGATALIGDPTGKSDMRKMLSKEQVQHNVEEVKDIAKKFIKTEGENAAIILSNEEWMKGYDFIDFMRDIGVHFNVNKMLSSEVYDSRLKEGGLTFLEMGYMLMQSYDFAVLNKKYGCTLQIGGSDQWGNIVSGVNLIRKLNLINENVGNNVYGITCPLLTTKEGKKMGKTENGALWVVREKTSVFDFYQYFYNVNDEDVETLLRLFTRLSLEDIKNQCNSDIINAKKTMAYEITKIVHGEEEAKNAKEASEALFSKNSVTEDVPTAEISKNALEAGIAIVDLMTSIKFTASKSEARRLIDQGGISVNNEKVNDSSMVIDEKFFEKGYVLLKKGKKSYIKVVVK
ncbi:tyrosine--tRNA ligase [Clostridium sp. 19966]|uniref:tyrosine--tRNA ligase n=1 Tax=Clostridium sp. 19966 TaxID=2768166 RepID=UPI0028DF9CDC|nr:tyrosine--tRNA ligase [Clostridium sp. 19966]MDT8716704.1 tyrosine--tRNA ligase [Clostridium sp. 19966]